MKISQAVRTAWKTYVRSPGDTGRFLLAEACLILFCLAPLLCLSDGALAPGAALCLPLWILVRLPARMNAALAMKEALAGGRMGTMRLIDTGEYGKKLVCGLKRLGFLLLWSAPLLGLAVAFRAHFSGEVDGFTVLRMVKNELGGGDQMRGILVLLLMLLGALLLVVLGCAFHSGARHAWAQGRPKLPRGRHGRIMLAWLASLLSILPALAALAAVIFRYLPVLSDLNGLLMNTVSLPSTRGTLIILGIGAALTVPLLPLRSLIPAAFVAGLEEKA